MKNELEIKYSEAKKTFTPKLLQIILPEDISSKKLFFNEENQQQIDEVFQLTSDVYDNVINRFEEHGLQPGLTFLIHGTTGTGKTELVKQLAKQNNRVILMVDLSQIHSMHIGQSERNIKNLFSEYKSAIQYYERTPILIFNDADAIISNKGVIEKQIDLSHNSVLNLLLQELENFEGILIATTNSISNIDSAFDRRILYKLCLEKPDNATRFSILKQNFKDLNDDVLLKVANEYSLTGAQIENIKRRCLSEQLFFGTETSNPEKFIFKI